MRFRTCVLLAASLLALLLSACGGTKSQATATTTATTTAMPPGTVIVRAYFVRGAKMATTGRKTVRTRAVGQASIGALLTDPNAAEKRIGFGSSLADGTELRKITLNGDRLTVRLSRNLDRVARAQVVTTLTQYPSVHDVVVVTPAGSTRPLRRANFEDLMPSVLVESPIPFARVRSPLRIRGTSNTFEATSQLELLDANGKRVASKFVTASSGSGTRGILSASLSFEAAPGPATLVSFEYSAKDGSRINVVRIPVRISR